MKKINQLIVIEADPSLEPLLSKYHELLSAVSTHPVITQPMEMTRLCHPLKAPELVLLHSNLTTAAHLQKIVQAQSRFINSTIIIAGPDQDEAFCLRALEVGVEDCIREDQFSEAYLQRAILLSLRRSTSELKATRSREQLLACIQNTPNVAVQWYNSKAEVLFWNGASEAIFGWSAEEALGKTLDQLIHTPQDEELWVNKIQHIAVSHQPSGPQEWEFNRRNGSRGCCISTLFPIPSFDEEPWFVCMDVDITDRKQVEKELRESEERYHMLFNQASDAIFINDEKGRFLDMNQRACDLLGYTKDQLLNLQLTDVYSEEELRLRPIMWKELFAGERTSLERNILHSSGAYLPVEITARMFKPNRVMAIVRDISRRKKVEEALIQSEEKYRLLIEQQADAIAMFDDKGRILNVNSSAVKLLNYSREELLGMNLSVILSEEDMAYNPVDYAFLDEGYSTIKQRKMRRKDGTLIETEVHTKKLYDSHFLSTVRDLTERMEVQRQLEKEKELSDSIINSLPGLFYLFRKDGQYLRWNKEQELVTGYSAEEISKMRPLDYFAEEEKADVGGAIAETFQTGHSQIETLLLTKDGRKIPYYFTGIAVNYAGTECLLGMGINLSAIKSLEKELDEQKIAEQKRVMQAMIHAEEQEKSKLGLELHDNVNQILSVVRMYLAILDSGHVPEGITLAQTSQLLNRAIDEIRNLSHRLAVSYSFEAGLTEALKDMLDKIQAARGFSITLRMPPALNESTNADQKLAIYRIVQEQLSNIIKHARATEVMVHIDLTDDELQLEIKDNGKGFNPLKVEKGLGLSNIINRAEALEGKASIQSAPGKGSRVTVQLPLPAEKEENA